MQPQQALSIIETDLPHGRQFEAPASLEQWGFDELLEPFHLKANRRLRSSQLLRGAREASRLHDGDKGAQNVDEALRGLEAAVADMKSRCERMGRKVRYALNPFVALGRDEADALDATIKRIFAYDPDPDTRKIEQRMLPATRLGCIGSTESVLAQLRRFEAIGIELVLCKIIPTVDNVRRIGEEIIAPLHAGAASALSLAS